MYLAFDLSTQTLKAILMKEDLTILSESVVSFDKDLPEFQTVDGVLKHPDGLTVTSPTLMWVKAVDMLLNKIVTSGCCLSSLKGISGTGQQHGSVYWRKGSESVLRNLNKEMSLEEQLKDCIVVENSPIWMDSSTSKQCRELEKSVGSALKLAEITGSTAYERFTGNQIAKIYKNHPELYLACDRISLVSSFLASLFIGSYAPTDYSDGSGMNLLNIQSKDWEESLLKACSPDLYSRLGKPVPSHEIIGTVSDYMVKRYGFNPDCKVIAFTGDNPASLAGMRLQQGDVAVSLGTSDTLIFWLKEPKPALEGHIFVNPVNEYDYMALLCFKNGSLTRESIRDGRASGSWDKFNEALLNTKPGNNGMMGVYFLEQEIIPFARGVFRWNQDGKSVISFPDAVEVRALIESQFLSKRFHAEKLGYHIDNTSRILATGGASSNSAILQVLSDVFNAPVYTIQDTTNSACLGCAYRAKHALMNPSKTPFQDAVKEATPYKLVVSPNEEAHKAYNNLIERYARLEEAVMKQ